MRPWLLLALVSMLGLGCVDPKPAAEPRAEETAAKGTGPSADLGTLDKAACQSWADHFASRLREATRRRIDQCDKQLTAAGRKPIVTNGKDMEVTDAEADRLHAMIVDQCSQQAGASYPKSDAWCFLASKTMEGWKSCPFQSRFFADFKTVAQSHQRIFDDRCKQALATVNP